MPITKTVYDPFGNEIVLSQDLAQIIEMPNSTLCIDASLVITNPAMMVECTDGTFEKYYFRTIEWDNLVLVRAKKVNECFLADHYQVNPPNDFIHDLLKRCRHKK